MPAVDPLLWVVMPYACLAAFVIGHARWLRRGPPIGTSGLAPLFEPKPFRAAVLLFHAGAFAVVAGHVLGLLVPAGATSAVGLGRDRYHAVSLVAGSAAGLAMGVGLLLLLYRRLAVPAIRSATTAVDLVVLPLLVVVVATGMLAFLGGSLTHADEYRDTVGPWLRGLLTFRPDPDDMAGAPFVLRLHAACVWSLVAVWPFTWLVHVWDAPVFSLRRVVGSFGASRVSV